MALNERVLHYFSQIFATDFLPHGVCMRWQPGVLWLHVISDGLITLAYLCIPLLLIKVVRQRKDIPFHWMFIAFGTFILACGATHALSIVTLWYPVYRLDGLVKAVAALASVTTAVCLAFLMPLLLKIPTAQQMDTLNVAFSTQSAEKQGIAQALQKSRDELTQQVHEQTLELSQLNRILEQSILEEQRAADLLRERERQFQLACRFGQVETWIWDLKTRPLETGAGASDDSVSGGDFYSAVHPEDRAGLYHALEEALHCSSEFHAEFRKLHLDGTIHWVSARGAMEYSTTGERLRMVGANVDITARKEAEIALHDSQEQFEVLADNMPNLAWMAHADGYVFWYNRRWYEFTNTTAQQMEGWGWQSVHDPEHLDFVMERWLASIRTGREFEMEFPLKGGDGKFNWFLTRVTPVTDAQGRVVRWFGTNTDITEIKEIGEELREGESHFRQIANSLPQMLLIAGPDGSVQWLNQRWYDYTGSSSEQSDGDGWMQYNHPEHKDTLTKSWKHSIASAELHESESRVQRQDGVYRWFLVRGKPVVSNSGEIVKWFVTYTDVDDYKQAESEIRALNRDLETRVAERTAELVRTNEEIGRTQTWLRAVLDSATQVVIIAVDNKGVIMLFNSGAERLLGYSAEELVGKCTAEVLHRREDSKAGDPRRPVEHWRRVSMDMLSPAALVQSSFVSENVYVHKDGTLIDVSLAYTPMIDASGQRLGTLGFAVDITRRKALERQLYQNNIKLQEQTKSAEEANSAKSEFLAAMSHEIRTPMNAILGMSDLLWESELEATQRQYVEVFRRAGANLLTLVNNILDLSKIEAGQFELEQIDFDLAEIVERTVEMIRPKTQAKRIGFLCRIAPGTPTALVGDPIRLQQVLINLLDNAVKFTERGEIALTISASVVSADAPDACRLRFNVTDTGIGIEKDKLDSVFHDFTQGESSTTRRFGGTGLGLGICRRLVGWMQGQLSVRSEFGKGSSFEFDAAFTRSRQDKPQRTDLVIGIVGRSVLIVDNNNTNRLIFSEMCAAWGMEPTECATADSAMTALQEAVAAGHPFDLVIMDRLMPGVEAFEFVARIRRVDAEVPIIIATSDKIPGDETRSKNLGLAGYTVKPVRRSELLRIVCNALGATERGTEPICLEEAVHGPANFAAKGRILIAEDSEDNRFLLKAYLNNAPYEITFVENGKCALDIANSESFDLLLMDIQMPIMDGLTATKLIREREQKNEEPRIPIVALTANARKEDIQASQDAGCNTHLSKPISKSMLLKAIQANLRRAGGQIGPTALQISVPPGLEEGAKRYIQSRKNEVPVLLQLLQSSEFERIRMVAHDIKGTGTSFGFPHLTRMGGQIEQSARARDAAVLSNQLLELSAYVRDAADAVIGTQA